MKTNIYIDGFNLYYGCLRGSLYRWLDPLALCQRVFPPPRNVIHRIRYFTALVRPLPGNPQKLERQKMYLRALATLPCVSTHLGQFLTHVVRAPLAHPAPSGPTAVEVIRTDEKGSDVNLASYLLVDAYEQDFEVAIIVSNDSDLATPITLVQEKLGLTVGVLNPHLRGPASWQLRNTATFYRKIRISALAACQFPATMWDAAGAFQRPMGW